MWLMIVALGLGVGLGYFRLVPSPILKLTSGFTTGGVMLLLFLMGAQIGSNDGLRVGLGRMGVEALTYAAAAIIGSIIAVKVLEAVVPFTESPPHEGRDHN